MNLLDLAETIVMLVDLIGLIQWIALCKLGPGARLIQPVVML